MGHRFLRENSQILSAAVSAGYCTMFLLYRNFKCDLFREDHYEFRNKKNLYEDLTVSENEGIKKFLYRLSGSERKFEFYRSCTFDFVSTSFNDTKAGAQIGLPTLYFHDNKEDFLKDIPAKGFNIFGKRRVQLEEIKEKLADPEAFENFLDNCSLSEDAKLFGLSKAVVSTDHYMLTNLDATLDFIYIGLGYTYCFSKNRQLNLQLAQRRKMYLGVAFVGLCVSLLTKVLFYPYLETFEDKKACKMGLDCAEGAQEFFEKNINRNKMLRKVTEDGHKYFDKDGNYLRQVVYVPYINKSISMKYMGKKLTHRRDACKKNFENLLIELNKEGGLAPKASEFDMHEEMIKEKKRESKEIEFFKNIRLKLEEMRNTSSNK